MIKTAISFTLGCVLFLHIPELPSALWLWASIPVCSLLLFNKSRLLAFILLGALWAFFHANLILHDRLPNDLLGQDLTITGTISTIPEYQSKQVKFEFKPDQKTYDYLPKKIRLNWYYTFPQKLNAGERWQLTVRLKQIHGMNNPGTFDYQGWLFQKGIGATGYVRSNTSNKRLNESPFYSINAIRQALSQSIELHIGDSKHIGLLQGLTTGIRHNISQEQWQILRFSGTSHLLAISGLHIGLAAAIGFFCFRWLWAHRSKHLLLLPANEAGAIGGFITALFYTALAGFSIPSQRALIMVTVVMLSLLIRRSISTNHILASSLLLILLFDPLAVLAAGFWLSFSAVAIILFVSQHRYPSPSWQWAKIHILIAFGLTPLLLLFFMQTSLVAPIANIMAIPVVSILVVPILLLSSLLLWLFEPIGILLLQLANIILGLLWSVLEYFAALPFSHWFVTPLPVFYWIPVILGSVILLFPKNFPAKWIATLGLTPLFLYSPVTPNKGDFWFTLLDVGQGLSAVIQTKNHTLIYDAGPKFSDKFNTGTAVVQPFLQHQGINKIDTLLISHSDNDHIGGAIPLIKVMSIDNILSSAPNLLPAATACHAGQSWQWDNVTFTIIHPQKNSHGSENNLSCVLKISNQFGSVLLTGDIESHIEKLLMNNNENNLPSSILVAPHHGSNTSSSTSFIQAVQPDIVLFATGYKNRYNFPHHKVVDRYQKQGVMMLNTANHGAIHFKFTSHDQLTAITNRQSTLRIWTSDTSD